MSDYTPKILTGGESRSDDEIMSACGMPDESPLVVMELLQRFRVKDVMRSHNIICMTREDTLQKAKELMRDNKISGLPVVENGRLFGLVLVNTIVNAMEGGWLLESCGEHMSTNLVVMEEDMPLTHALKSFHSYTFGRFPVLNKEHEFVGIISQRDVTRVLLKELTREVAKLEGHARAVSSETVAAEGHLPSYSLRQFTVLRNDLANAGKAANEIKRVLKAAQVDQKVVRRIAVAAYELEINVCIHSLGGTITLIIDSTKVSVIAKDSGPGIRDIEWACQDGTSTANDWIRSMGFGAGMGLSNCKRVSDVFNISSSVPKGTTVICEFEIGS